MEILDFNILHNSLQRWLLALGIVFALFLVLSLIKNQLLVRLKSVSQKTRAQWDDAMVSVLGRTRASFLFFISLVVGLQMLKLPEKVSAAAGNAVFLTVLIQLGMWGAQLVTYFLDLHMERRRERDLASTTTLGLIRFVANTLLFTLLILVGLNHFGVNITALIAGLGVGGIAVALAVQNILGDLFASLTIVLDKPFVVGDFIATGEFNGTVERIGLKTTRIRSLSGEQLIFSNNDLLQSRLRNFKRMNERRVVFKIQVTYQTSIPQIKKIPAIIRGIIQDQKQTRFDRSHFFSYGASSLDFETVYWVTSPDYNVYMDIQQTINLEILKSFQEEEIEFAYPTQTLFIEKTSNLYPLSQETSLDRRESFSEPDSV